MDDGGTKARVWPDTEGSVSESDWLEPSSILFRCRLIVQIYHMIASLCCKDYDPTNIPIHLKCESVPFSSRNRSCLYGCRSGTLFPLTQLVARFCVRCCNPGLHRLVQFLSAVGKNVDPVKPEHNQISKRDNRPAISRLARIRRGS